MWDGTFVYRSVLNLIINGLPSIPSYSIVNKRVSDSFKPYYKWITFNTDRLVKITGTDKPSFKPYYKWITFNTHHRVFSIKCTSIVLNLIINGLPSILCTYISINSPRA